MASTSSPLNLSRLAHFVEVADAESMTVAAARLHVSQQAVSSSMKQLERELGVALLVRTGRHIDLTPAGHALRLGAIPVLAAAKSLKQNAINAARDDPAPYVIGHTPAITSDEVFELIGPIRRALPSLPIVVQQEFPAALEQKLLDTSIDLGFRRGVITPAHLSGAVVAHDPLNVAVSADHPLAARESIPIADLADHSLIVWGRPGSSFYTDHLLSVCRRAGFEPQVRLNRIQGTAPATAVVGTSSYAFVTQAAGTAVNGRVRIITIEDAPRAPTQAIWLPYTTSAPRRVLLDAVGSTS